MSKMLTKSDVRTVTLSEIKAEARALYYELWEAAKENRRDLKLYLHWTAGRYGQFWDDYHIQIDADGLIYMPRGVTLADVLEGTYGRNTGSVAITLLGCFDATTNRGLGTNPPTAMQIEVMARVIAVLSAALDLTIDIKRVMTHGEAADNEDGLDLDYSKLPGGNNGFEYGLYGPKHSVERWDLEYLGTEESPRYNPRAMDGKRGGDVLRGKAAWYRKTYPDGVEKHFA